MSIPPGFSLAAELERKLQAQLDAFGVQATLHPRDGSADVAITGIIKPPAIPEAFVVRFFVWFAQITPSPQKGDAVTIDSENYDLFDVDPEVGGGAVLKLRRKNA